MTANKTTTKTSLAVLDLPTRINALITYADGGGDGSEGRTLLERLIDGGLGGMGHNSGLHGVLLEVHGELAGLRLGTWSQGEKRAEIRQVLSDAVDSGQLGRRLVTYRRARDSQGAFGAA